MLLSRRDVLIVLMAALASAEAAAAPARALRADALTTEDGEALTTDAGDILQIEPDERS